MGAQQAWEWAVRFPERVRSLAVFAGTREDDSGTGPPGRALPRRRCGPAVSPRTPASGRRPRSLRGALPAEAWRDAGFESVDDMVRRLFEDDYAACDAADLLCQLGKWRRADVSRRTGADLRAALGRITARTFVAPVLARRLCSPSPIARPSNG